MLGDALFRIAANRNITHTMSARNHRGNAEKQHIMGGFLGVTSQLCAFVSCFPRRGGRLYFWLFLHATTKPSSAFICARQAARHKAFARTLAVLQSPMSLFLFASLHLLGLTLAVFPPLCSFTPTPLHWPGFISTTSTRGCVSSSGVNTRHTVAVVVMQSALKQSVAAAHSGGLRLPAWC